MAGGTGEGTSVEWIPIGKLVVRQLVRPRKHENILTQIVFHPDSERPARCIVLAEMMNFIVRVSLPDGEFSEARMSKINQNQDGSIVLRRPATNEDLVAFVRLWPDDVLLSVLRQQVTEANGLYSEECERFIAIIGHERRVRAVDSRSRGIWGARIW